MNAEGRSSQPAMSVDRSLEIDGPALDSANAEEFYDLYEPGRILGK